MLENFKTFVMVVDCQGFRAASKVMKISTSVITRRIEMLEEDIKVQLIKRNSRKILITEKGQLFYKRCISVIEEYESCIRDVKGSNLSGSLKVGIPHSINNLHIIPNLNNFFKKYPEIRLNTITGNHSMELFSHGFDLAIQCGPLPDCNLYYSLIGYWRKHTIVSKRYVEKFGLPKHPNDLINHACIIHFDNIKKSWKFSINGKITEIKPRCLYTVSNSLDIYEMVKNGLGIAYLPDFTIHEALKNGEIISIFDEFMPPPLPMYIVYANQFPSQKEKAFIDFIYSLNLTTDPVLTS